MKEIRFYPKRLRDNHQRLKEICKSKGLNLSYMIKKQLMLEYILKEIDDVKIYTTGDYENYQGRNVVNIYGSSEDLDIVDIFDKREGIEVKDIIPNSKETAIVNFYCGNKKAPTTKDLINISKVLREKGYKNISLGGTLMLFYDFNDYDEIRIGEGLLVGYAEVFSTAVTSMKNPFEIDCEVVKGDDATFLIKEGVFNVGNFLNRKAISVGTDWTILEQGVGKYSAGCIATLYPDYWTLIKLAHNGLLNDVKIIGD